MNTGKSGFFHAEGRICRYDRPSNTEYGNFDGMIVTEKAMAQR